MIAGLARLLRPGDRMLVVPTQISYPFFATALEQLTAHQPDPAVIAGERAVRACGQLTYERFLADLPDRASANGC